MVADILNSIVNFHEAIRPAFFDAIYAFFVQMSTYTFFFIAFFSAIAIISTIYVIIKGPSRIREPFLEDKDTPTITIQIPTKDDLVAINCAKKCLAFDYPKNKYEIFIGDDSKDPNVSRKIRMFAKKHKEITVFRRADNRGFKAGNFNNLLKHTTGEYIVTFDSDFLPEKDFLRRIVAPMVKNEKYSGVQARWNYINVKKNVVSAITAAIPAIYHHIVLELTRGRKRFATFCGSAQAIRTSTLREVGGWNESHGEDIDLSLRFLKKGHRIAYLPQLECLSEVPFTLKDASSQQMRWAYGVSMSLLKNKDIFLSKNLGFVDKLILLHMTIGYWFIFGIIMSYLLTILVAITVPLLTSLSVVDLVERFLIGTAFTFGFIFSGAYAMMKTDIRRVGHYFASVFTVGIFFLYSCSKGLIKGSINGKIPWGSMEKTGGQ